MTPLVCTLLKDLASQTLDVLVPNLLAQMVLGGTYGNLALP